MSILSNDYTELPERGTSGHLAGTTVFNAAEEAVKIRSLFITGCPVNKKTPTKMTQQSFKKMCTKYQKKAGIFDDKETRVSTSTAMGWSTTNLHICGACKIGMRLREGLNYKPPVNITFISQETLDECWK